MNDIFNLTELKKNFPKLNIVIANTEVQIRVFFNMNCCEFLFNCHEQGDDFRTSFVKSVFHMYKQDRGNESGLTESDFMKIADTELHLILNEILEQDNKVKFEYNKMDCIDDYEKFFYANKTILYSITASISKSFESISKMTTAFNIPHPIFNMQAIISPLQNMVKNFNTVDDSIFQVFNTPLLQVAAATQKIMSNIDFSLLTYRSEWSVQRKTLLKYGWFYSAEIPKELINDIHMRREELSTDDVNNLIISYFRQNKCESLKKLVKQWEPLHYFNCRKRIFHEALVNHSRKYFNTSVTLLTIHTEGVITDFVRIILNNPRFKVEKAIEDIKEQLEESKNVSFYEFEVFNDVIEQIEEAFKENFNLSNPDATSNRSRHKIAHGHVYETENEVNSLKRFLYLNEIYFLFLKLSNIEQAV